MEKTEVTLLHLPTFNMKVKYCLLSKKYSAFLVPVGTGHWEYNMNTQVFSPAQPDEAYETITIGRNFMMKARS